jgi:ubiquinone/menaquinone biosynthesis C-methylase UbiE
MAKSRPVFSRFYKVATKKEGRRFKAIRADLVAGLSGTVIEVGCGNGMMFEHYPEEVSEVVAVEPEPILREAASKRAIEVARNIQVLPGTASRLPAGDASADAVVFSLVLCSVNDVTAAASEAFRVVRPGGQVRIFEHTIAPEQGLLRKVQKGIDPVWKLFAGGCRLTRDPIGPLIQAGFTVEHEHRQRFRISPGMPVVDPQVIATLTRP